MTLMKLSLGLLPCYNFSQRFEINLVVFATSFFNSRWIRGDLLKNNYQKSTQGGPVRKPLSCSLIF